jgi:hypothetical protein
LQALGRVEDSVAQLIRFLSLLRERVGCGKGSFELFLIEARVVLDCSKAGLAQLKEFWRRKSSLIESW